MEKLPQEIIDQIIDYSPWLTGRRRAPTFATVSKRFQLSIERHTFREIDINHVELERFADLFTHPHRRNVLKHLGFKIKLLLCQKYPEATEREANNKVATNAILNLLNCLCRWEKNCNIGLFITARPYQLGFSGTNLDYQYDYLEILYPEQLPPVDCIRWLLLNNPESRKKPGFREFSPLSYLALATKLPCLKGTFLSYTEPGEFLAFRQSLRENLVQAISKAPSMAKVYFNIDGPDYTGHDPPSLVPSQQEDSLSLALRRSLAKNPQPFWENITYIFITLNPVAPSGTWYFRNGPQKGQEAFALHLKDQSPPGYGTEEQTVSALAFLGELTKKMKPEVAKRNFQRMKAPERFDVNPDTVMPLLRSVTRAIAQMRSLQIFKLRDADSLSTWYSTNSLKVEYYLPGVLDREYREELDGLPLGKPRVLLRARGLAESGCCASELEDMFRKVSIANHHQEAVVTWI
ncbi:hypothetical protein COL26b_013442 [Colletotrichum chrysophilum]|uniref:uncharacterized protein n=1 Tax=Colletotrichum chrysophilum TaxID=1836956 RepID=UPI0023000E1A|nr:uncharacterized protein COL26b_013442 [Colletotrichum chrysophilum]KAJ0362184.1 hypothetical protein COL26b_013442 [Colletotrichum chrysophilum]